MSGPNYYEQTAAKVTQFLGPENAERLLQSTGGMSLPEFIEHTEKISGKPFLEMNSDDFERRGRVQTAETDRLVLNAMEASELTRIVTASMRKRGAATTEELRNATPGRHGRRRR
jgi:hypothetical protein